MFCNRPWILRLTPVLLDFAGDFDNEAIPEGTAFSDFRRFAEGGVTVYTVNQLTWRAALEGAQSTFRAVVGFRMVTLFLIPLFFFKNIRLGPMPPH